MQERRSSQRVAAGCEALVSNLSSASHAAAAVIIDISMDGASIATDLPVSVGDALAIRLPGLTILAEAAHTRRDGGGFIIGAKLRHSLHEADVLRCAEQFASV